MERAAGVWLQSLVWRHQWEHTQDETYRDLLVTYNREDCHVLKQLTDELSRISSQRIPSQPSICGPAETSDHGNE